MGTQDFGIPQHRERVYVIGIRRDVQVKQFEWPLACKERLTLKQLLGNPATSEKRNLQEMTHDADGLALSNTVRKNLEQFQEFLETRWAREPKSKTAHSTPFLKFSGAGSCALHEIDAISLWRHREH